MNRDTEVLKVRAAMLLLFIILLIANIAVASAQSQPAPATRTPNLESIILIEDMIEWTEWDIEEGKITQETGYLLIMNLERLKEQLSTGNRAQNQTFKN